IQEQLGVALVHVAQAQQSLEDSTAARQPQLGSLLVAAIRTDELMGRLTLLAAIESLPETAPVASTDPASWPEMPIGFLIVSGTILVVVFFAGLSVAARSREAKAATAIQHNPAKWVYRLGAGTRKGRGDNAGCQSCGGDGCHVMGILGNRDGTRSIGDDIVRLPGAGVLRLQGIAGRIAVFTGSI